VGLGAVLLVLLVEGFALRDPYEPAPRDIDASVKRAQTLGLAESGLLKQALPYRAGYLDPRQWYLPFVKPFVIRTRTGMQSIFPTVAAAIDVPAEWLGGLPALRLVSLVSMLMAVLLATRYLRAAPDIIAPVAIMLATPLWFYAPALILSAVFMLVAVATTNTSGGKPLGPRLLLPAWLLLAAVAWQGVRGHARAGRRALSHGILAAGGAMLVLAGFIINAALLMPRYRAVEAESLEATRYLARTTEEVVVLGSPFAIEPVVAAYPSRSVMLASSTEDAQDIAMRLRQGRVRRFLFVRRNDREDLVADFPSFTVSDESTFGRWIVQRWTLQ
jgi:hypothetical protein